MVDLNKILHQAFSRPSALTAFNRWLKTLASRGAEGATSALSLAMLVFLVQEEITILELRVLTGQLK